MVAEDRLSRGKTLAKPTIQLRRMASEMMNRYLYRGVNAEMYRVTKGQLVPKGIGKPFKQPTYFGGDMYWGDGGVYGDSERNAVIQHQRDSNKIPTSGVSTTPMFENARRYATHDGNYSSGYVFKIDVELLKDHGVSHYAVAEHATKPALPGDQEVILVAKDFGVLPVGIVVDVVEV